MDDCLICAKHRGEGPLVGPEIWRDDLVAVSHASLGEGGPVLGYLFVETLRHVPYLDDLTDVEAAAVGSAVRRAAIAVRAELDPEHVFSAVIGRGIPHFHQHVFPRHRGMPEETPWHESANWAEAPRGGEPALSALAARLRRYFTAV
jgi:ATP adenylyltransferase